MGFAYSHLNNKEEEIKNTTVQPPRIRTLSITPKREVPSSIIWRDASRKWVIGKAWDRYWRAFGVPSRLKKVPEKIIIGQVEKLIIPLATSTLLNRDAKSSPREI